MHGCTIKLSVRREVSVAFVHLHACVLHLPAEQPETLQNGLHSTSKGDYPIRLRLIAAVKGYLRLYISQHCRSFRRVQRSSTGVSQVDRPTACLRPGTASYLCSLLLDSTLQVCREYEHDKFLYLIVIYN